MRKPAISPVVGTSVPLRERQYGNPWRPVQQMGKWVNVLSAYWIPRPAIFTARKRCRLGYVWHSLLDPGTIAVISGVTPCNPIVSGGTGRFSAFSEREHPRPQARQPLSAMPPRFQSR